MSRILVTGGAGFIGCNFVRHLLDRSDAEVAVLDKLTYAGHLANLTDVAGQSRYVRAGAKDVFEVDICDRRAVLEVLRSVRPTAVVNFAAESHVDRSIDGPGEFVRTNVVGTFELLEAVRHFLSEEPEADRRDFRLLHVSTDEVYGSLGETGLFTEDTPYAPNSPYAASKASADHLVRAYFHTYGLPALITNCSNNYGPYQYPEKLIPLMILNALDGKELPIYGRGDNVRDWIYVDDHCAGVLLALERGRPGEKYNIGGHNERSNVRVVDRICDLLEELVPAAENPALAGRSLQRYRDLKTFVEDRPGHDWRYAIDSSKIRDELGWEARHDFDSGLRETVRWYVENYSWCEEVTGNRYNRQRLGLGEPAAAGKGR